MPYIKEAFDVVTFDYAKHVVLSNDPNNPNKFEQETNFLVNKIKNLVTLDENSIVLDFGCGMGRIAKEIINRYNSKVIGLDISPSMLMFAKLYTANINKFVPTHQYNEPDSVDVALSIFALQHSENPQKEIDNIVSVLKPNGSFILVNQAVRYVPSEIDKNNFIVWHDDGFNIFEYVETKLKKITSVPYMTGKDHEIILYRKGVQK